MRSFVVLSVIVVTACAQDPSPASPVVAASTQPTTTQANVVDGAKTQDVVDVATDAYVFGYALMISEVTRIQSTSVMKPEGVKAPINQLATIKDYVPADVHAVTAPNRDTLYTYAWVDTSEPMILSHPDMGDRFYLFQLMDEWTNVIRTPGSRADGGKPASYVLTGPGWNGTVPKGMTQIASPTRYVVVIGRTYSTGTPSDIRAVNALQARTKLAPASLVTKPPQMPASQGFSLTDKPPAVVAAMPIERYFDVLAHAMCDAKPTSDDAPMVARMATIGLEPCKPFDASKLDPAARVALRDVPLAAARKIEDATPSIGKMVNGWVVSTDLGRYGTDYMKRAAIALSGWGANLAEDAVYPTAKVCDAGARLRGDHDYTITFAKNGLPPAEAFWSVTMYEDQEGLWLHPNPQNKFDIGSRTTLKSNADGTITIYVQQNSPGASKESNWLPAPKGNFALMMRLYAPRRRTPSILDGTWQPPAVHVADAR